MKKKDFEKWALEKYSQEFAIRNGVLTWFRFPFWDLNGYTTRAVLTEFKQQITNRTH